MFGSGSVLKYMIRYFLVPHLLSFLGGTLGISGYIGAPPGQILKTPSHIWVLPKLQAYPKYRVIPGILGNTCNPIIFKT